MYIDGWNGFSFRLGLVWLEYGACFQEHVAVGRCWFYDDGLMNG